MPLPNFLIIGAPKCGTTSLHFYLQQHPSLFMPVLKEPNFFSDIPPRNQYSGQMLEYYDRRFPIQSFQAYQALFDQAKEHQAIGEASIAYLSENRAAERIYQVLPEVRMIVILRNPVDRAFSSFQMCLRRQQLAESFEDALAKEETRRSEGWLWGHNFMWNGLYATHLETFFKLFPRDQFLILFFEDLQKSPQETLKTIFHFLKIDSTVVADTKTHYNPGGVPKSSILQTAYLTIERLVIDDYPAKQAVKRALPPWCLRSIDRTYRAWEGWYARQFFVKQQLNPATRQHLVEIFRPEVERLEKLTGRGLSHWLR
ncbi:MAG: sulfotransferase [Acidobacteria bacterium]|nr:sulfotransferase [Acidobacteriota bacterium]